MDVYSTIVKTWRSQVDSSWQRSAYFAAFEIAAIGGCWFVISRTDIFQVFAGVLFAVGGALTVIWLLSTHKMWGYLLRSHVAARNRAKGAVLPLRGADGWTESRLKKDNANSGETLGSAERATCH